MILASCGIGIVFSLAVATSLAFVRDTSVRNFDELVKLLHSLQLALQGLGLSRFMDLDIILRDYVPIGYLNQIRGFTLLTLFSLVFGDTG